jgi:hypothetical protein
VAETSHLKEIFKFFRKISLEYLVGIAKSATFALANQEQVLEKTTKQD